MAVDSSHRAFRTRPCRFFAMGHGSCINDKCCFAHIDNFGVDHWALQEARFAKQEEEEEPEQKRARLFAEGSHPFFNAEGAEDWFAKPEDEDEDDPLPPLASSGTGDEENWDDELEKTLT